MTTKEKIIHEALLLFSKQGYEAVSVRDISRQVGIKESSLYNHFKNKQDIFDSIIVVCQERAMKQYTDLNLQDTFKGDFTIYQNIQSDLLLTFTTQLFSFYVTDEYLSKFRQMLTIEQYNNPKIQSMFRDTFIEQALQFQSGLFQHLMATGSMIQSDPMATALEFYSPIFLMLYRYDSLDENVLKTLKAHIDNFALKNNPKK